MPRLSAESLLRALREDQFLTDLVVMVLSSDQDAGLAGSMLNRGVDGFAFKGNTAVLLEHTKDLIG